MQTMYALVGDTVQSLDMPGPDTFVLPGIRWGGFDELLTPAYWHGQVWHHDQLGTYKTLRLGNSLLEETAACLLGGYPNSRPGCWLALHLPRRALISHLGTEPQGDLWRQRAALASRLLVEFLHIIRTIHFLVEKEPAGKAKTGQV